MKSAGHFNFNEYMERLNEEAAESGGVKGDNKEGLIIPAENKKSYDWLKKEYNSAKTEVKVEIKMGGAKFEPGYDFTAGGDTVKEFKPGMFGEIKTGDTEGGTEKKKADPPKSELNSDEGETKEADSDKKDTGVQVKGAEAGIAKKDKKKPKEEDA